MAELRHLRNLGNGCSRLGWQSRCAVVDDGHGDGDRAPQIATGTNHDYTSTLTATGAQFRHFTTGCHRLCTVECGAGRSP
jgi:hypothetical protein